MERDLVHFFRIEPENPARLDETRPDQRRAGQAETIVADRRDGAAASSRLDPCRRR